MVHGVDQGLILPTKLAPDEAVIVQIFKSDEEKTQVMEAARRIRAELVNAEVRVTMDEREGVSAGFKFNDWEMRGVPLRIELGHKDVAKGSVVLARRDKPGKEGKSFVLQAGLAEATKRTLAEIQQALHDRALAFRKANTGEPKDYGEFKQAVETGFALPFWSASPASEAKIKKPPNPTTPCIPLEQSGGSGSCILCGQPPKGRPIFAKAY